MQKQVMQRRICLAGRKKKGVARRPERGSERGQSEGQSEDSKAKSKLGVARGSLGDPRKGPQTIPKRPSNDPQTTLKRPSGKARANGRASQLRPPMFLGNAQGSYGSSIENHTKSMHLYCNFLGNLRKHSRFLWFLYRKSYQIH